MYDVMLSWYTATLLLSTAAMLGHVFPASEAYTTTLVQQFTVEEEQPAGTVIGRVVGVSPPLRAYFTAGSDAERDLTVAEDDGSVTARARIDREALDPASAAQYRFVVASGADDATVTVTVFVTDVNDHAPTFPDDLVQLTLSEAAPLDARLSLKPAVDRDVGTNAVQVFCTAGARPEFFIGGKTEGQKAESGGGVLGEEAAAPSPPARGLGEHCELLQRGSGWSPDRPKVFHYFQHSGWPLLTL